jgi:hypothetical protein
MPEHFQPKIFVATKLARARGVRTEDFFSIASGAWRTGREALFFSRAESQRTVGPPRPRPLSHCDVKQRGEGRKTKNNRRMDFLGSARGAKGLFWRAPKKSRQSAVKGSRLRKPQRRQRKAFAVSNRDRSPPAPGPFLGCAPKKSPFFSAPKKPKKSLTQSQARPPRDRKRTKKIVSG